MQDSARFFAYATWVIMISLGIILASNPFLVYVSNPGWIGLATLLAVGFVYLNLSYAAIKRYITKVPEPTNNHIVLATIIFLPAAIWIYAISENAGGSELILILVVAFACGLGTFYGNRAGIRARYEYIQKVKERQANET
jgi:uncharacterized membrane protein YoaK (UPF0700 family)